jgi:hypothetical protein
MEIRVGWATEYGRSKFDVSVDETDLARLCREHGISSSFAEKIVPAEAFQLLLTQANWFSEAEAWRITPDTSPDKASRAALRDRYKDAHLRTIHRVKVRLGLEDPDERDQPQPPAQ